MLRFAIWAPVMILAGCDSIGVHSTPGRSVQSGGHPDAAGGDEGGGDERGGDGDDGSGGSGPPPPDAGAGPPSGTWDAAAPDAATVSDAAPAPDATPDVTPPPTDFQRCRDLPFPFASHQIDALAASRDARFLAISDGAEVAMISIEGQQSFRHIPVASHTVDVSADGTLLAVGGKERRVYRVSDGVNILSVPASEASRSEVIAVRLYPDARHLLSALADGTVNVTRLADGKIVGTFTSAVKLPAVALSPDATLIATSATDLWRFEDLRQLWERPGGPRPMAPGGGGWFPDWAEFSPDGTLLLVSHLSTEMVSGVGVVRTRLLRVSDGSTVMDLGDAHTPHFSPDGRQLLVQGQLIELSSMEKTRVPGLSAGAIFLSDGRIVAPSPVNLAVFCPVPR